MKTHTCAWPSCKREILDNTYMCSAHWFNLPWRLRASLYESYEINGVTAEFKVAEANAKKYITEHFPITH